jgi:hypothetical protein
MKIRRTVLTMIAAAGTAAALVLTAPAAVAAPAAQQAPPAGTSSLAALLAADGTGFDRNWYDFDILDNAVGAVLASKPTSPVAVLADGTVPLTAFLPNDRAFQVLAFQLTRKWYWSEADVLGAVAGKLGIDAVESVLLYHVVPGVTIDAAAALKSKGAVLSTALSGQTIKVDVLSARLKLVRLVDGNRKALDPFLVASKLDLNKGNVQIAHGISLVLQPAG